MAERKRKVADLPPAHAADHPAGPDVATMLREGRMQRGLSLSEVAATLRIRLVYLQAIEQGRFSELPGNAYAAGFLRSYAEFLGLDVDLVLRRFKDEVAGKANRQELYFPTPVPEERVPGGTLLLGTLVLAGIVYGGWYYLSATDRSMVDFVPALPDRLLSLIDSLPSWSSSGTTVADAEPHATASVPAPAAPAPAPAPSPAPAAAVVPAAPPPAAAPRLNPPPAVAPAPGTPSPSPTAAVVPAAPQVHAAAPAAPTPAPPPPAASAAARPPLVTLPPAPATAAPATPIAPPAAAAAAPPDDEESTTQEPTPLGPNVAALPSAPAAPARAPAVEAPNPNLRVYGSQNQTSRIQLRATQDSWVQVRDGNELLFTRVLRPGDVYRVPDRPGIKVRTGNAGGLVVITDGVEGGAMGSVGQVLRDVPLEAKPAAH